MLASTGALFAESFGASYLRNPQQVVQLFTQRGWRVVELTVGNLAVGNHAFLPPHSAGLPILRPMDEKVCKRTELESLWLRLGAKPNPDDEFFDFIGSPIG
jgi:hypothetical protein